MSFSFRSTRYFLAAFAVLTSSMAGAQAFRGALTGTVVDASGAAIPNATIRLSNPATNDVSSSKSNGAEQFSFPELPVGTYKLFVTSADSRHSNWTTSTSKFQRSVTRRFSSLSDPNPPLSMCWHQTSSLTLQTVNSLPSWIRSPCSRFRSMAAASCNL
jgi:hypothetical protein